MGEGVLRYISKSKLQRVCHPPGRKGTRVSPSGYRRSTCGVLLTSVELRIEACVRATRPSRQGKNAGSGICAHVMLISFTFCWLRSPFEFFLGMLRFVCDGRILHSQALAGTHRLSKALSRTHRYSQDWTAPSLRRTLLGETAGEHALHQQRLE